MRFVIIAAMAVSYSMVLTVRTVRYAKRRAGNCARRAVGRSAKH